MLPPAGSVHDDTDLLIRRGSTLGEDVGRTKWAVDTHAYLAAQVHFVVSHSCLQLRALLLLKTMIDLNVLEICSHHTLLPSPGEPP